VEPLQKAMPERPEVRVLKADLSHNRNAGIATAKDTVESEHYRKLVLKAALWLVSGDWSTTTDALVVAHRNRSVVDLAADVLTRRTKKAVKKVRKVANLDGHQRHKLRIAIKKLRYATGFFESLFLGDKRCVRRRRYVGALKTLQNALGRLNDISVHARFAQRIVRRRKQDTERPEKAFAIGLLTGKEQSDERACLEAAVEAGERLAKAPQFWR
jgi:triphosphatase